MKRIKVKAPRKEFLYPYAIFMDNEKIADLDDLCNAYRLGKNISVYENKPVDLLSNLTGEVLLQIEHGLVVYMSASILKLAGNELNKVFAA